MASPHPFTPTPVRRSFDKLLVIYPHLDPLMVEWSRNEVTVELGEPSAAGNDAWARWRFVIERASGRVYCIEHNGEQVELNVDW